MGITTEGIVESMCRANNWKLLAKKNHNWFVVRGHTIFIDEADGCRIVCKDEAFAKILEAAFDVAVTQAWRRYNGRRFVRAMVPVE